MKQLLPYTPMPADVEAAIQKLQRAEMFDAEAFAVLNRERWKRGPAFIAIMIPLFGLFMGLIWVVDTLLTTIAIPMVLHVFGAFLFAVLMHSALLRDTMKDHMRLGRAIERWEEKGGRIREKPLERKA